MSEFIDVCGAQQAGIDAQIQEKLMSEREQIPSLGRIVHYRLSAQDVEQIMRRRTTGASIAERMKVQVSQVETATPILGWPTGAQAHIGNDVAEGETYPMLIVRVWGTGPESAVNGQVFLDGNDVFWATSRTVGIQPGTFGWPART